MRLFARPLSWPHCCCFVLVSTAQQKSQLVLVEMPFVIFRRNCTRRREPNLAANVSMCKLPNRSQAYSLAPVTAKNHNKLVAAEWEALAHNQHTDGPLKTSS